MCFFLSFRRLGHPKGFDNILIDNGKTNLLYAKSLNGLKTQEDFSNEFILIFLGSQFD
jgi:hypothetical protein